MQKHSIMDVFRNLLFMLMLTVGSLQVTDSINAASDTTSTQSGSFGSFEVGLPGIPAGESIDQLAHEPAPILNFINTTVNATIAVLVIVGLISITIGGYLYMTAAGNGGQVKTAKEWILAALVGIFLALASVIILTTINNYLGKDAQEPTLGPVEGSVVEGSASDSPSNAVKNFNGGSFGSPGNLPTF